MKIKICIKCFKKILYTEKRKKGVVHTELYLPCSWKRSVLAAANRQPSNGKAT
jgi:hypothetical protein